MTKFGHRIKSFRLWCSVQSENAQIRESMLVSIMNLIPNVEQIILRNILVRNSYSDEFEVLDLHKLRKLEIDYCQFDTPEILNRIPADVLHELVFTFESQGCQRFFNQQTKIKKLELFENEQIKFDHLELEHLKISSGIDFVAMINQQPRLRYIDFAITWIDDSVFSALCQLKHLEVAKMLIEQVSCRVFKSLREIPHLKELRLDMHSSYDYGHLLELSMMHCVDLEKLTLLCTEHKIPEEIFIQMSLNFRNLRDVQLINRSINVIRSFIEHFPNLESMLFDFCTLSGENDDVLAISEDLKHENLKQLVVTNINITNVNEVENTKQLLKLISVCPNLQRIMLSKIAEITHEDLKTILTTHPTVTHLSLECDGFEFKYEMASIILESGKKLQHLRLNGLTNFPSYPTLQAIFEDTFPNITLYKYSNGEGELIMKRRNIEDWYDKFKLMDHF